MVGLKIAATAAAATAEAMQGLVTVTQAVDRVADTASLVSIFAKHPAIAPYVQNLLFASSDEQAKRYLDDLTNMGFRELGLILVGIYKPRRTHAMNAASGNGAKPNPHIHQSQGNTNIPTNTGSP